jgi:hypothetical protein
MRQGGPERRLLELSIRSVLPGLLEAEEGRKSGSVSFRHTGDGRALRTRLRDGDQSRFLPPFFLRPTAHGDRVTPR